MVLDFLMYRVLKIRGALWSNGYGIGLRRMRSGVQTPPFPKHFWFNGTVWQNGLTKRFDGGDEKLFDGTVWRVVWRACLPLTLRASNLALGFAHHDVRGGWRWRCLDQDIRGCIYKKGSKNRFELVTRLNVQRLKLQWWTQFRYKSLQRRDGEKK